MEEAKRDLENSLVQLDLDCQQSIDKLVTLKDNLQKDYNDLEEECDALKIKEEKAEKRIAKLDNQLHKVQQENGDLKKQINTLNDENYLLKEQIASLKGNSYDEKVEQEKSDLHKKYINILASSMKKYVDGGNDVMEGMQDSNVIEYTKQVESVLKLLLDFKLKTESLEKELYDLREEKSKIIGEKNHEIEKLLKNSEILSQEVITKTQTIKDYENECSELMKNNDLLINELDSYKNNSGLETISESNEDNMVLLEIQLENANKQINDLKEHFRVLEEENRELKTNFENNEYKYTELKVLQDGWNDEIEKYKKINKNLENINAECETKIQVLQNGVEELNKKLLSEEENRLQFETEKNNLMEKLQSSKMAETTLKLHFNKELQMAFEAKQEAENKFNKLSIEFEELKVCNEKLLQKHNELLEQQNKLVSSNTKKLTISETNCMSLESESNELIAELKTENAKIQSQLNELINLINEKQQENITYHTEIQRLNQIVLQKKQIEDNLHNEIEKLTDQNGFLQEKCEVLTQTLLQHQSTEKELERLRVHLVEIEETYTQELLLAEQKNQELQAKMNEIEEREKNSSTLYTSVSIRANQQVEALQNQIQMLTNQRDELRQKISDAEDENSRQAAALANLNFVLQQFQRGGSFTMMWHAVYVKISDKENDVRQETERIRRQIKAEKQVQQELEQEIASLKSQLEESRQGLRAATRLGDQLEFTKKQNAALKEEGNLIFFCYGYFDTNQHASEIYILFFLTKQFVGPHMKYQLVILGVWNLRKTTDINMFSSRHPSLKKFIEQYAELCMLCIFYFFLVCFICTQSGQHTLSLCFFNLIL